MGLLDHIPHLKVEVLNGTYHANRNVHPLIPHGPYHSTGAAKENLYHGLQTLVIFTD